nr:hypothetical protein [Tanacetum cinerariifolium]
MFVLWSFYTTDYCCSDGSLRDKIICDLDKTPDLSQRPPQNCPKCGNPVDGHYCQGYYSKPSNDNTNVVNALQEPFVVKQDPGKNSSQSPPQINHHCCYGCGDPLEDIFCHQCTYELCGRGAHYGYNCPSKVPVVPNPEPFNNQTVDELQQTMPSFNPTCYSEDGNSFTYDSTSYLVHDSPNIFNPPLQPPIYSYEFYGNDAYYGQDCSLQVPFTYDLEPCYNQDFNFPQIFKYFNNILVVPVFLVIHQPIYEKTCAELLAEEQKDNINTQPFQYSVVPQPPQEERSAEFFQEKINQINYVKTFLRKFNRISFYEMPKVLSLAWEKILEIELAFENKHCQPEDILEIFRRLHNDVQNVYDLSTEEPDNSLSMRDEHLHTVLAKESDEFIKSSVENLVPILSESEGIPENMCDVPFHDNSPPLDVSKDQFEDFSDSNDESTSVDDDSFSIDIIEYVEASPPNSELVSLEVMEIVIPEVGGIDDDIFLTIKDDILRKKLLNINLLIANIEALKDNPASSSNFMTKSSSTSLNSLLEETNTFDNSFLEFETFCFNLDEISSGSTTTRSDISLPEYESFYDDHEISSGGTTTHSNSSLYDLFNFDLSINPFPPADRSDFYEFADELSHIISSPEYDCFCFKSEPNLGDFTMDVVEDIFSTREPRLYNAFPTHPTIQLNLDFILSSESLFAYVIWIFLPFLSYSVAP